MIIEIRSAGAKGRGIFAMKDIEAGEKLCYYDGIEKPINKQTTNCPEKYYMVSMPNKPTHACFGYIEPKTILGIGQLVNDGAMIDFDIDKPVLDSRKEYKQYRRNIKKYIRLSKRRKNIYINENLWFYSLKPIKKDCELLWSYSPAYWIVKAMDETKIIKKKNILIKLLRQEDGGVFRK